MARWLARWAPVREGEGLITSLMFLYIFGVLTFYYIVKPLKDGLFLANYPSSDLPYPNFLTAIFAGTLATLVFRIGRRVSVIALLTGTNVLILATLICFFWAIGRETTFLPYVFYVYVQIVSVLSTAQFWLLAGYIYDNQQAKRLYGLLGAGAIAGAMAGSSVSGILSRTFDLKSESMLLVCIAISALLIVLSHVAWRYRRRETDTRDRVRQDATSDTGLRELSRMVFGSRHLMLMVGLIFLTLIASQIADWQVKDALYQKLKMLSKSSRKEQITEFLANLYLVTNVMGIILQLVVTNFVVRRFGITGALVLLPAAVFTSSWGVLVAPGLWTAVMVDGGDAVFRYSVARAGLELLYLPLSPAVRKRLKFLIDVFVDRLGRFAAAVIILAFTKSVLGPVTRVRGLAAVVIVLAALSLLVCYQLRRSYAEAFRRQLTRREVDLAEVNRYVNDPASVRLLVDALESTQERQILYALGLLQSARGIDFSRQLLPLLEHASPHVRAEAARTLHSLPGSHTDRAETLLRDPEDKVRVAAVEYLCAAETAGKARLRELLGHESIDIRLAAARCASESGIRELRPTPEFIRSLLAIQGERAQQSRRVAARLAAALETPESLAILRELLKDPSTAVATAAARSAGSAGRLDLFDDLAALLTARALRSAAREALVMLGDRVAPALGSILRDPERPLALRREVPWVLGRIATRRSSDILVESLAAEDPMLKYRVVKALNRLHEQKPDLPAAHPVIAEHIYAQSRAYYEALVLWQAFAPVAEPNGSRLLVRALKERLDQNLELIFRLLGLQYPQKDIYFAYTALQSGSDRRGAAIEFLDNLLQRDLKAVILPLVEERSAERLIDRARGLFGIEAKSREEALRLILEQSDAWLKACALHEIGDKRLAELTEHCRRFTDDPEPLVRETAGWAVRRLAAG